MEEEMSRWHRRRLQGVVRKCMVEQDLRRARLSEARYEELKDREDFVMVLALALETGVSWDEARIDLIDAQTKAANDKLKQQLNVDNWRGGGTNIYTYNDPYSFGDELETKHRLGGHIPKRGPISRSGR